MSTLDDHHQPEASSLTIFLGISRDSSLHGAPGCLPIPLPTVPTTDPQPTGTYLLILVIAGLRVGLCGRGRWWGVGGWVVATVAPVVVGGWWWRWRWWGCIALVVTSLAVGWLAVTRLQSRGKNQDLMK